AHEPPPLIERFTAEQPRFAHYVDATVHEMAARDNFVIVGLASTLILANAPHTLRVRITAAEPVRAERLSRAIRPGGARAGGAALPPARTRSRSGRGPGARVRPGAFGTRPVPLSRPLGGS